LLNQLTYAVLTKSAQCIYNLYITVTSRWGLWGTGHPSEGPWESGHGKYGQTCSHMSVPLPPPLQNRRWKGALERRTDRRRTGVATDGPGRCSGMQLSTCPDIFPPDIYPRLVLGLGPRTVVIIYFPRWWFSGKGAAGRGQMSCHREGSDCAADDKQCTAELLLLAPTMTPALHHLSLIQSDCGLLYNSIRGSVVWSTLYCDRHGRLTDRCSPSSSVCVIDDAHHCVWTKQSYPFHRASVPVDCESIFYQAIYAGYHCIDKMPF